MRLPAGQQLGGFTIVQQIGHGAMGTVYRARQNALERDVALKVLNDTHEAENLARFRDEAIRVGKLAHPNILPVYDFGTVEDVAYIAMMLADGGTLTTQIGAQMTPEAAIKMLAPAAQAIDYAHENKIIHRDVKPANLLFDAQGRLYLADFGLALLRDSTSATWGAMLGTPSHMAPEQFRSKAVPASDIYALAVTLFQLLTGRVPYERENPLAVALAHLKDPVPSVRDYNPDVSELIDRIVRRGMAKDPANRYQRAIEMLAAIKAALRQSFSVVSPGPLTTDAGPAGLAAAPAARPAAPGMAARPSPPAARPAAQVAAAGMAGRPGAPAPARVAAARPAGNGVTADPPAAPVTAASGAAGVTGAVRPAPEPGRTVFESQCTLEWAKRNLIITRNGKLGMNGELIQVSLSAPNQVQMMVPAGVLKETWAELQFGVAPASGLFDILFHEAVVPESHCVRVDPQQSRVAIGLVPASGSGEEKWLAARKINLDPGTEHSLLLVASGDNIDVYLDGGSLVSLADGTLKQGMARLRMLPAGPTGTSTLLLRRIAFFRPPE